MSVLLDPFRLFGRLVVAVFKISSYTLIFLLQIPVFIWYNRRSEIAEGFGEWGRAVTDALAKIVE